MKSEVLFGKLVEGVAERWEIEVRVSRGREDEKGRHDSPQDSDYAFDSKKRIVWISPAEVRDLQPERLLHELVHVIVQPPRIHVEDVDEGWLLIPFERELARSLKLGRTFEHLIIEWQRDTSTTVPIQRGVHVMKSVGDYEGKEERTEWWKAALYRCERLGLTVRNYRRNLRWENLTRLDWLHVNPSEGQRAPRPPYYEVKPPEPPPGPPPGSLWNLQTLKEGAVELLKQRPTGQGE